MSSAHEHESHTSREPWIDRWWPLLLILFGLTFTLCLALFRPGDKRPTAASLETHPVVFALPPARSVQG